MSDTTACAQGALM